jgi:hypothetical protein
MRIAKTFIVLLPVFGLSINCDREESPTSRQPSTETVMTDDQLGKQEGNMVVLHGIAERRKLGPWLQGTTFSAQVLNMSEWPDDVVGQKIEVRGTIRKVHRPPPVSDVGSKVPKSTWTGSDWLGINVEKWEIVRSK